MNDQVPRDGYETGPDPIRRQTDSEPTAIRQLDEAADA